MNNSALRRLPLGVFLILLLGTAYWVWFRLQTNITLDDAFITFRYAQDLALGRGFVFNEGERVLGTTTPLLTMILAFLAKFCGVQAIPVLACVVGIVFGALTAVLNYVIVVDLGFSRFAGYLAMAIYFATARVLVPVVSGMETPLVLFLMALSLHLFIREYFTLSLVVCSLLLLTRIDGVVWSLVVLAAVLVKVRRLPRGAILACGVILIPWAVFSITYFGGLLPHSIAAKQTIRPEPTQAVTLLAAVKSFVNWYVRPCWFPRAVFGLYLAMVCVGGFRLVRDAATRAVGMVLLAFSAGLAAFLYLGDAPHWDWYSTPSLWANLLICAVGVEVCAELWGKRARQGRLGTIVIGALIAGTLMLSCVWGTRGLAEYYYKWQLNQFGVLKAPGLWLRDHSPVESTVATESIGYQGFYSRRKVIDVAGLVSPAVVKLRKESRSHAEAFLKIVTQLTPDYIVLAPFQVKENRHYFGGPLFEDDSGKQMFLACYREVKRFGAPYPEIKGFSDCVIFKRESDRCVEEMRNAP
jgi:hypothetical protein